MDKFTYLSTGVLSFYSILLIILEIKFSQSFVRSFFTDIQGNVPFYAINTSLSVFFLSSSALLFVVCLICIKDNILYSNEFKFYFSQSIFFAFMAIDDRFLIHEMLENQFKMKGLLWFLVIGFMELFLLFVWGKIHKYRIAQKKYILMSAILFFVMIIIDSFFPDNMILRLSLEDLSKTWSCFFIFLFSWSICVHNINKLKKSNNIT